jgi:hypothetical protein
MNRHVAGAGVSAVIVLSSVLSGCSSDGSPSKQGNTATGSGGADSGSSAGSGGSGAVQGTGGAVVTSNGDSGAPVVNSNCTTDPTDTTHAQCGKWLKVEIPGTVCGDGSQFKFFVNYSNTSNDLVVSFEPGGACWDYASCSGAGGIRGAANPHGIADNHMDTYQYLPLHNRVDSNPVKDWNMVFVSYCTGDIHTGNNVIEYSSAELGDAGATGNASDAAGAASDAGGSGAASDGGIQTLLFHHAGHANTLAVIDWMSQHFKTVPKMLVTGCSAGGAGALLNYHFIRKGMGSAVAKSYLLDDSGPIFHSDGPSKALHEKVRSAWNVDSVLDGLQGQLPVTVDALKADFGLINTALADKYASDRLALTLYRMDLNYSLYSYQRFFSPSPTEQQIHAFWWQDLQELMTTYDSKTNLAYFIPYFRSDNCSHCVSIPPIGNPPLEPTDAVKAITTPWLGSEIQADKIDLHQFVGTLIDDTQPLKSYIEDVQPSEKFTSAESAQCMEGG